jgi:hypothetical protein
VLLVGASSPSRPLRTLLASALALSVALALWAPAGATASSPSGTLGVYRGPGNPARIAGWEAWVGHPAYRVLDSFDRTSWSAMTDPWAANQWRGSGYQVVYSLPMLPLSGASLSEAAKGTYNDYFKRIAQNLINAGQPSAVLRLGWEMNGSWYPWSIGQPNGTADYVAAWRQIVGAMRSVPGAAFSFDWCVDRGGSWVNGAQLDPAQAYPGDQYVDYIGMDVYDHDWSPGYQDPIQRWQHIRDEPYGLAWHRDFAAAHGKPMTFPEWGLSERSDGHGGGDDPYFVERMADWISQSDVAYQMYFEYDEGTAAFHTLMSGRFPLGAARFQQLFGPSGTSASQTGSASGPQASPAPTQTTVSARRRSPGRRSRVVVGRVATTQGAQGPRVNLAGATTLGDIRIRVERERGGQWHPLLSTTGPSDAGGSYTKLLRLAPGRYRVSATYLGSQTARESRSPNRAFTVAPR